MSDNNKKQHGCDENAHIDPRDFSLWNKMNGVCIGRGITSFMLWPTRMGLYICCSGSAVKRSARRLVKAGWLEVLSEPTSGKNGAGVYRVVNHRRWVRKNGLSGCILKDYTLLDG
jgi:hypothetical protein